MNIVIHKTCRVKGWVGSMEPSSLVVIYFILLYANKSSQWVLFHDAKHIILTIFYQYFEANNSENFISKIVLKELRHRVWQILTISHIYTHT